MISSELRNTEDTDWLGLQQIHSLSYENVVSADDETAPGTAPGLNVYPNPFKDEITINLNSAEKGVFEAGIYNLKGQLVRSFTNQKGKSLIWDGKDKANNAAAAGLYFVRINQNRKSVVQKIVRVK
jgi:flagellar hook assembly protein FlgD